jgi:hypothetical protein
VIDALDGPAVARPDGSEAHGRDAAGKASGEEREPGGVLDAVTAADHGVGGGSDEDTGTQDLGDGVGDVLEGAGVVGRDEEDGEVGFRAHLFEELADGVAHGMGRHRVLGERSPERHVTPPGAGA